METKNLDKYIELGMSDKDWYQETELLFIELFGKERLVLVANLFAATSINSSLKSNITLFRKALHELEKDKPFSNYLPNIKLQLERIRKGEDISGRKIRSFARAMSGGTEAVVVDIWLLRAFNEDKKYLRMGSNTIRSSGATDRQYSMIEDFVRERAFVMELQPRQLSAIIWSGVRRYNTGKGNTTRYHEILKHKLYNMYEISN